MKLKIKVSSKLNNIEFFQDQIIVTASNYESIIRLLNDQELRSQSCNQIVKDLDNFDISSDDKFMRDIQDTLIYINNLPSNINLSSFSTIDLIFNSNIDPTLFRPFFENSNLTITVDISGLSISNILKLKNIQFSSVTNIISDYNEAPVSPETIIQTYEEIERIKNVIDYYNLSPLEKIFFLYDLIKERKYTVYRPSKLSPHSRDLTNVLFEKEIVCLGYSNIFAAVTSSLGIKNYVQNYHSIKKKRSGHASNIVFIEDAKYNIKGVYEFDTTWDAKKQDDDLEFRNKYHCFANSLNYSYYIKELNHLFPYNGLISRLENSFHRLSKFKDLGITNPIYIREYMILLDYLVDFFANFSDACSNDIIAEIKSDMNSYSLITKLFEHYLTYFNSKLSLEVFTKAFYMVRRIEHNRNPIQYPLDMNIVNKIVKDKYCQHEVLKFCILNDTTLEEMIENLDIMKNINCMDIVNTDIKRMELIHVLKKTKK